MTDEEEVKLLDRLVNIIQQQASSVRDVGTPEEREQRIRAFKRVVATIERLKKPVKP